MANQIVVSAGAKVRNLQDVIIGTSGVLTSLGFDVANGVPRLDVNGKILVSQLPNSVMEYKGTWNAATNTPTLVNGTGNQGDVYLCNVAGTVDFGAGPIAFVVGDQVIYSGSIWQRASGATGTVTSVAVTESGDSLNITGSPITTSGTINIGFNGTNLQYVNGAGNLTTFPTLITSIGLTMPSAFSVANSPLTANGTIAVTGAGVASQYIRGDGTLASFPTGGGGGSSVSYYLNGGTNQGTFVGNTYYEMSKNAVIGTGVDFTINANGYISQFITDANDPAQLVIPAGNWNFEMYFSASSNGGSPSFYVELYKYNGSTFTLIADNSANPEYITNGTAIDLYTTAVAVPETSLTITDRLAIRVYVTHASKTITLHTQNSHLCQVITTFSTGITALNGLTAQVQYFQTGTSGSDFNISSTTATHTFNLPTASASNRGALSSADWSAFNAKQNAITLTTTGTSGAATLIGATLNIPNYANLVTSVFGRTGAVVAVSGDYTTAQVTESGNLYFTDSRARLALSFVAGSGAYNSTTGVITIPTNNNQITNGSNYITLTSLSAGTGISYNNTTGVITNSAPDQTVSITAGAGISVSGTYPSFTIASTITQYTDALARLAISLTTTGSSGAATYNNTTGVLNIPQYIGGVTSVFGRTGAVVATEGDYSLTQLSDVTITTPTNGQVLKYNGTAWINDTDANSGTVTSVAMTVPTGLSVSGSPITTSGTLGVTFAAGYSIPTDASQTTWDTAYTNRITSATSPLSITSNVISISQATTSTNGYLSSTDWNTFNGKGIGTVTSVGLSSATSGVTIGSSPVTTSGTITLAIATATTSQNGLLSSTDWTTFNGKESVLTFSSPLVRTTNTISIPVATTSVNGYLSSTDWTTFNGKQGAITLTTTGTSGAATLVGNTLNIPQYSGGGGGMAIGGSITSATAGSVLFAGAAGVLAQDNANFFWDDTNNRLGIGTTTPQQTLEVYKSNVGGLGGAIILNNSGTAIGDETAIIFNDSGLGSAASVRAAISATTEDNPYYANIKFKTGASVYSSLTTRMIITGAGNVGIGTLTPSAKFHISGTAANTVSYISDTTGYVLYQLGNTGGGLYYGIDSSTGSGFAKGAYSRHIYSTGAYPLILSTNDTERVRILSGGAMTIGNISATGSMLQVNGSAAIGYSASTAAPAFGLAVSGAVTISNSQSATNALSITGATTCTSSVTATSFFESSDSRLKTLIQDNYQTKGIASITPKLYTKNGKVELGYYAQDFVGILDSAVVKGEDEMLSLSYREVHTAKIYALEQEIKELKAKMN